MTLREGGHTIMDNVTPFRNIRFEKLDRVNDGLGGTLR
jgi:hypothetical protein